MKKSFLFVSIFLLGFFAFEADAKINISISGISPNPADVNAPVQINVTANDPAGKIIAFYLYVDGIFSNNDSDVYDCTQGTNNPVDTCSYQFVKRFSSKGNHAISASAIEDKVGETPLTPAITLVVVTPGTPPPPPSADSPSITSIDPNPAQVGCVIEISGTNFCPIPLYESNGITVIFDQTAISGGIKTSVSPLAPPTSACSPAGPPLLRITVPSSLIPNNNVNVSVSNSTKGAGNPTALSLTPFVKCPESGSIILPPGISEITGISFIGVSKAPSGKLQVSWPNSPLGTPLNDGSKLTDLIRYLYEWGISLGGFAAFIALIIAGFQYLTSAGNAMKMKDAMDRIRSAGLGLVLLFGSFIILNTINPQLTKLDMPAVPSGSAGMNSFKSEGTNIPIGAPCTGATLSSGANNKGDHQTLTELGRNTLITIGAVGSAKMDGSCQLFLYQSSYCIGNSDNIVIPVSQNEMAKNIGLSSGGMTNFKCAKLFDAFIPPSTLPQ